VTWCDITILQFPSTTDPITSSICHFWPTHSPAKAILLSGNSQLPVSNSVHTQNNHATSSELKFLHAPSLFHSLFDSDAASVIRDHISIHIVPDSRVTIPQGTNTTLRLVSWHHRGHD